jgi:hypothetical protein
MSKTATDLKPKFTYTKTNQTDSILLYAVSIAICSVGTLNTTLHTRKIYNLLKSNSSKLILFNTSDSRYLYYVKYSHNLLTYSITIKMQWQSLFLQSILSRASLRPSWSLQIDKALLFQQHCQFTATSGYGHLGLPDLLSNWTHKCLKLALIQRSPFWDVMLLAWHTVTVSEELL